MVCFAPQELVKKTALTLKTLSTRLEMFYQLVLTTSTGGKKKAADRVMYGWYAVGYGFLLIHQWNEIY